MVTSCPSCVPNTVAGQDHLPTTLTLPAQAVQLNNNNSAINAAIPLFFICPPLFFPFYFIIYDFAAAVNTRRQFVSMLVVFVFGK